MSTRPQVPPASIIIPAFNAADFILTAIDSARAQTYPDLQIVVVNDGSTDGTAAVLEAHHGVVEVLDLDANQGSSAARNAGLCAIRGEIVGFHDADDTWAPDRLALCVEYLRNHLNVDLVTTEADIIEGGRVVGSMYEGTRWPQFDALDQFHELLLGNFMFSNVVGWARVFRDHGGFDESLRSSVDYEMWLRLTRHGERLGLVQRNLAQYVRRPGALSSDRARQRATHFAAISRHVDAISRQRCQRAGRFLYQAGQSVAPDDAVLASKLFRLASLDETLPLLARGRCLLRSKYAALGR